MKPIEQLKFNADGLIPVIAQDCKTKEILMMAYMNAASLKKTISGRKACYYSRSRKKLWLKGEQSGNCQIVKSMWTDCDKDCLLILVKQKGGAACHTGFRSCFFNKFTATGFKVFGKKIFDPRKVYT